jgi:hypothetical protein
MRSVSFNSIHRWVAAKVARIQVGRDLFWRRMKNVAVARGILVMRGKVG